MSEFFSNLLFAILLSAGMHAQRMHTDSVYTLDEVAVVAKSGVLKSTATIAGQTDCLTPLRMQQEHIVSPKDFAAFVPNLSMPDYGSAMTSTICFRGLGSRIDQPAVGLLIDGVPLLDKNAYDQPLQDIRNIVFRRGPQGTLYGRNTMAGVLEIEHLQPLDIAGQRLRARVDYSTANTVRADASVVRAESDRMGWSLYARYGRSDGFFRNTVDGLLIDHYQSAAGRWGMDFCPNTEWRIQTTASVDWIRQGAFPYASAATGEIALSDPSSYERLMAMASARATYSHEGYRLRIVGSYQYLGDDMRMDQDYTAARIFTLRQQQQQHSALVDAFLTGPEHTPWYRWSVGLFCFVKHNRMMAPVTFLREGIDDLILYNANVGIRKVFPNDSLEIEEQNLIIEDNFRLIHAGVATYHQSTFIPVNHLYIDLGIRLDMEYAAMHYDAGTSLHYRMTALMKQPKAFCTRVVGQEHQVFWQALPRLAIRYEWPEATLYGSIAKGSKAGGYNPQIFSTIIQNRLMQELMHDMGVHLDNESDRYTQVDITRYKPESAWNFEIGAHYCPAVPVGRLRLDADFFYIRVRNQQLTVFPDGNTTGRMMTNAARARSLGAEFNLHYDWRNPHCFFSLDGAYGFTDARFVQFSDGYGDYSGQYVPYVPLHTASLSTTASYRPLRNWLRSFSVTLSATGRGRQYWNEQNTLSQPFYGLLSASVLLEWPYVSLDLWAKNLTGTSYNTFYFVSMSHPFYQRGLPRQLGATVSIEL